MPAVTVAWLIACALAAVGDSRRAAERDGAGHRRRRSEGRAARRDGDRHRDQAPAASRSPSPRTDGRYRLENLPPGQYKLRIELPGFATAEIDRHRAARRHQCHGAAGLDEGGRRSRRRSPSAAQAPLVDTTLVAGRRQHRPPPDGGAAAAGPQLAGAVADGQGHDRQQHRQHARRARTTSSSSISTASRSRSASPARASGSPRSAARRSPSSRSSPTCSTSRRAARPACRCRRSRARAPTTCAARPTGSSAATRFNAADPVANKVLPFQNQQVGGTLGGPIIREQGALLRLLRIRAAAGTTRSWRRRGCRIRPSSSRRKDVNKNYLGRVDYQQSSNEHLHASAASAGRSTTRSRSRAARRIRRRPTACSQHSTNVCRHLDARRQLQPDDAGARRLQRLLLVQRRAFRRTTCSSTTRRSSCRSSSFPGLTLGGQRELPELHLAGHLQRPAGHELAQGQARHRNSAANSSASGTRRTGR